jgi:hypothetical protein
MLFFFYLIQQIINKTEPIIIKLQIKIFNLNELIKINKI